MRTLFLSVCACSLFAGAAMAAEPASTAATALPAAVQCVGAQGVVYFNVGAVDLNVDSQTALRDVALARHAECTTQITLTGHTDSTGSINRNRQLARQRATAVQRQLVTLGVPQEEIAIGSAGEIVPQSATDDRLNRRVSVVLVASPRTPIATPATAGPS